MYVVAVPAVADKPIVAVGLAGVGIFLVKAITPLSFGSVQV
jgi:hypothetical protein